MKLVSVVFLFSSVCYCKLRVNEFSIELLHFTQLESDGHVFLSPFGIFTLLTGVSFGTTGNTANQLKRALFLYRNEIKLLEEFKDLSSAVLSEPNEVTPLNRNYWFLDTNVTIFPSHATSSFNFNTLIKLLAFDDPNVASIANAYITNSMQNTSSNVLRPSDFDISSVILVNVIYFRGLLFDKVKLMKEPFYNEKNEEIGSVNMMFTKGQFAFSNMKKLKSFAVEIPYGASGKYSFLIILPYPSVRISDIYQNFVNVSVQNICKKLEDDTHTYGKEDVHIKLPRFRINTNIALNKPLNDMGIYDLFDQEQISFKRATSDSIFVSTVIHKANIEVSTTGNAVTGTSPSTIPTPYFNVNRPFIYFVMEKTTVTVLFNGIYSKPSFY